ncbi:pyridoxal-dependent decarboxylase, partial [Pseudomonadales bacterium]|nr:pyridoxal-dependent decarboxylase [Pseudomonadales bacterium]
MLGDWLTAAIDQNVMVAGDSISTAVELQVIEWLRSLFELDAAYEGVLTSGATTSNLLGMLTARQFAGEIQDIDIASEGIGKA